MKFRGLMWWIDRWRKSTAYNDMSIAEQGAYRNLLDEATLRGGAIPNNERLLAKVSGAGKQWYRYRKVVLKRFVLEADGWHNHVVDRELTRCTNKAARQARWKAKHQAVRERTGVS